MKFCQVGTHKLCPAYRGVHLIKVSVLRGSTVTHYIRGYKLRGSLYWSSTVLWTWELNWLMLHCKWFEPTSTIALGQVSNDSMDKNLAYLWDDFEQRHGHQYLAKSQTFQEKKTKLNSVTEYPQSDNVAIYFLDLFFSNLIIITKPSLNQSQILYLESLINDYLP